MHRSEEKISISIASLLKEKEAIRYRESNNMNIFMFKQLITKEGDVMLT